jgi:hypothetical protein
VSGFLSQMAIAPDDDIGVVVFTNTGGLDGRGAAEPLGLALIRRLLGLPDRRSAPTSQRAQRAGARSAGCYSPDPGPATNLFVRALMGAGAEVPVGRINAESVPADAAAVVPAVWKGRDLRQPGGQSRS